MHAFGLDLFPVIHTFRPAAEMSWNWLSLTGPDAPDFLQRLSTANIRALEPGRGVRACFLNAQGRMSAAFWLWRLSAQKFGFELDGGADGARAQALADWIERYTFAENQTLERPTWSCAWKLSPSALPTLSVTETGGLVLCHHGARDFGADWVTAWGPEGAVREWLAQEASATPLTAPQLHARRIAQLSPWWGAELTEAAMPLEVGWREAIADNKGCYPGQEVIEKIIALGSPPRRFAQVRGLGEVPSLPASLRKEGQEVGLLTSAHATAKGFDGLAILRKTVANAGTALDGAHILQVLT